MPAEPIPGVASPLLVDLYELTMGESYLAQGLAERPATFQLFCRSLPTGWGYLVAAGIDDVLSYLEELRFGTGDIAYLEGTGLFSAPFLDRLAGLRFSGTVRGMPPSSVSMTDSGTRHARSRAPSVSVTRLRLSA